MGVTRAELLSGERIWKRWLHHILNVINDAELHI